MIRVFSSYNYYFLSKRHCKEACLCHYTNVSSMLGQHSAWAVFDLWNRIWSHSDLDVWQMMLWCWVLLYTIWPSRLSFRLFSQLICQWKLLRRTWTNVCPWIERLCSFLIFLKEITHRINTNEVINLFFTLVTFCWAKSQWTRTLSLEFFIKCTTTRLAWITIQTCVLLRNKK